MGRRKAPITDPEDMRQLALDFIDSAKEDLADLRDMYRRRFNHPHNACMFMARATEKMIKAKLYMRGIDADFIHDQVELLIELGISENDPIIDIAAEMSEYATQANYPSRTREGITPETAMESYARMLELLDVLRFTEPIFDIPKMPKKRQTFLSRLGKTR